MGKISAFAMVVLCLLALASCDNTYTPQQDKVVSLLAIPGVTVPVAGAAPVATVNASQYSGTISWSPAAATFAAATAYTATITLTAKAGHTLDGVAANSFTVAGASSVVNSADSGIVTAQFPTTYSAVVSLLAIPGVSIPATGATPTTTLDASQYSGTISWSPADSSFAAATAYSATITLAAKAGYTLTGVAANSFTVAGASSVVNNADSGIVTAQFPATNSSVVNLLAIPGITAPVTGATPVTSIDASQYSGTISWGPSAATFAPGTAYTATITLAAKAGYTLAGVAANSFTVAGASSVANGVNSGVVTALFPATQNLVVSLLAIPGVTVPVTGATPVSAVDSSQYSGTISWNPPDATFVAGTAYTATITLTAKAGYTLAGVAANSFTVAGASSVANSANSGVVTAAFPATQIAIVSFLAIPGVTVPVAGATPVTSINASQYTGTISWTPGAATFAGGTVYTANITLTAKAGYTMTGVSANSFTVAGASTVTNSANSGSVRAIFPATQLLAVSQLAIPGITAPVAGATPVTAINPSQYSGVISWNPPAATFAYATVYTATITLSAKTGYTFTGVAANSFTVAGASSATNSANSGVVTAVFPAAPTGVVNLLAIPGVTAPVAGAIPAASVDASQYSGTISWSPADAAFAIGTVYTASVTLTAKTGFTLAGVAANSFTVAGAASNSNGANLGAVTATFPATVGAANTSPYIGTLYDVPAGRFQRDATAANVSVISAAFKMSRCEITRSQYLAVMGTDPTYSASTGTNDPAQYLDWFHAIAFCNKLSLLEGLTPAYSVTGITDWAGLAYGSIPTGPNAAWDAPAVVWGASGYRLPTEMEWMWAAMGAPADGQSGGTNTTGYLLAFAGSNGSNNVDDYSWNWGNSGTRTHPSGTKLPSTLGFCDMAGNIWEWCWDRYATTYPAGEQIDFRGATTGTDRVVKGGSYAAGGQYCAIAQNYYNPEYYRGSDFGFRVIRP